MVLDQVDVHPDLIVELKTGLDGELDDLQTLGFVWFELLVTACYLGIATALVERVLEVLEDLRLLHGERFELHAPPDAPGHWDGERLKQALHNLLENAVKYGRIGAPISVRVDVGDGRLRLSSHNLGEPIPPDVLPDLFRPFRRAPAAISGGKPGWGLGLMLVQSIAEAHGGSVSAESSQELGTTFTIDVLLDARGLVA